MTVKLVSKSETMTTGMDETELLKTLAEVAELEEDWLTAAFYYRQLAKMRAEEGFGYLRDKYLLKASKCDENYMAYSLTMEITPFSSEIFQQ